LQSILEVIQCGPLPLSSCLKRRNRDELLRASHACDQVLTWICAGG